MEHKIWILERLNKDLVSIRDMIMQKMPLGMWFSYCPNMAKP